VILAVVVALDALVVRLVLIPALLAVTRHAAWHQPKWLARVLPKSGSPAEAQSGAPFRLAQRGTETGRPRPARAAPGHRVLAVLANALTGARRISPAARTGSVEESLPLPPAMTSASRQVVKQRDRRQAK
jgi:hypothetical protein